MSPQCWCDIVGGVSVTAPLVFLHRWNAERGESCALVHAGSALATMGGPNPPPIRCWHTFTLVHHSVHLSIHLRILQSLYANRFRYRFPEPQPAQHSQPVGCISLSDSDELTHPLSPSLLCATLAHTPSPTNLQTNCNACFPGNGLRWHTIREI